MNGKWRLLVTGLFMLMLAACAGAVETPVDAPAATAPVVAPTDLAQPGPAEVTQAFYDWYLAYIGEPGSDTFRNPLVDGAYRDSEWLSPAFIAEVDATLASFDERGGYDPILLAQDVPVRIEVGGPEIAADRATVPVLRYWGGNPDPSPMTVELVNSEGNWLIAAVSAESPSGAAVDPAPVAPAPVETVPDAAEGPAAVVQAFYDWYLATIGEPGSDNFRNPLVDRTFRDSVLLTEGFKGHIDETLDNDIAEFGGFMADPILCAQDIPATVSPTVTRLSDEGAAVVAQTSFANHLISVDLRQEDGQWRISNITCPNTPAGLAKIFYDWYLGTIGDRSGDFRNPLVERAYRENPLLADSLEQEIDAMLDAPDGAAYDPFLLAQDIPTAFSVDPGVDPATAVVHFQFGPDSVRHVQVTVAEGRIVAIEEAQPVGDGPPAGETAAPTGEATTPTVETAAPAVDASGWLTYVDGGTGVSFPYPPEWVIMPQPLSGPGMPDDWPVVAAWQVMPPDVAEAVAGQTSPPDPNAPIIVPPIQIEIIRGGQDQLQRVVPVIDGEVVDLNGLPVTVVTMEPGYQHYILAHPQRPDLWFVLTDWVTGFPGREAQAAVATPVVGPLLDGLVFAP